MDILINVAPSYEDIEVLTMVAVKLLSNPDFDSNTKENAFLTEQELFDLLLPESDKEAFRNWLDGAPFDSIVTNLLKKDYLVCVGNGYQRTGLCYFSDQELLEVEDQEMYELTLMCYKIKSRSRSHEYI